MLASSRIVCAALLTLFMDERSAWTNLIVTEALASLIWSIVGWPFSTDRPIRIIVDGEAAARDMAVSAPMPPGVGPVMRTKKLYELRNL